MSLSIVSLLQSQILRIIKKIQLKGILPISLNNMKINNFKNLLDKIIKSEAINHTYQIFIYKSALRIFKSYKFHFLHKILMLFLFNKIIILKLLI